MVERKERVREVLHECAETGTNGGVDPWPAIEERVRRRASAGQRHGRPLLPPRRRTGLVLVALVLVALGLPLAVGAQDRIPLLANRFPYPDDMPQGVEPVQTGPELVLAEGKDHGMRWTYTVYETDQGLCTSLNTRNSSGGGCGFSLSDDNPMSYPIQTWGGDGRKFVDGPTKVNVRRVDIVLENGKVLEVSTEPAPAGLKRDIRFFFAWVPDGRPDYVVAKGADGDVLDRHEVYPSPEPPPDGVPAKD